MIAAIFTLRGNDKFGFDLFAVTALYNTFDGYRPVFD